MTAKNEPWEGYGQPEISNLITEHVEHHPAGHDEDGEQRHCRVVWNKLYASNDAYVWEAFFEHRQQAEVELAMTINDPLRLVSGEAVWQQRKPYGSIAWNGMDEWNLQTEEEQCQARSMGRRPGW